MEELLQQILQECRPYTGQGALASYIPELARQDPDRLGIAMFHKDGNMVEAGDITRAQARQLRKNVYVMSVDADAQI